MQITVDLQDMFSYSPVPALVSGAFAFVFLFIFLSMKKKPQKKEKIPKVKEVRTRNVSGIKAACIKALTDLERRYLEKKIEDRAAFQELSRIIRQFVSEMTGVNLLNYTLEDMKRMNMPKISGVIEVIETCYVPEFAAENYSDLNDSIKRARKVIEGWN